MFKKNEISVFIEAALASHVLFDLLVLHASSILITVNGESMCLHFKQLTIIIELKTLSKLPKLIRNTAACVLLCIFCHVNCKCLTFVYVDSAYRTNNDVTKEIQHGLCLRYHILSRS